MSNKVFQQNLDDKKGSQPGGPYLIQMLFKEPVEMPDKEKMTAVMEKHIGSTECFCYDKKMAGFAAQEHIAEFKDGKCPVQLMVMKCDKFKGKGFDAFLMSQMWDCQEDRERIFRECKYQVVATDMLTAALPALERANLDADFLEALAELYPTCEAFYFQNCGKLFLAEDVRSHQIEGPDRFIRFGDLAVSARTCLEENYTAAVSLYKSGDIKNAMRVLGRAAHFISDMGCTVHVANMKYQDKANNVHYAFEKHVSTTCTRHTADSFDKRLLKYYGKDNFGEASNKLVKYAGKFVDTISHLDPRAFDDVAKNTLPVTQQNVTALLLKFYDDCTSDAGNYILDGKAYTFKNEISGLVLTVTPKGLQLEKPDKELEQKLTVCLTEDGTFGLKIGDGGYVNASCKGYDYLKIDGKPVQFRVTALGKRRFRISTESTGYVKVLANSKGGKLSFADLEPENSAQIWILN